MRYSLNICDENGTLKKNTKDKVKYCEDILFFGSVFGPVPEVEEGKGYVR